MKTYPAFKVSDVVKVVNPDDENGNFGKYFRINGLVDCAQYGGTGYFYVVKGYFGEVSYIADELEKAPDFENSGLLIENV
jgi:hypothetical protein